MSETTNNKPPLDVEQWLDFIIASAAHRSHDPGHQKFGEMLVTRYFTTLPERYKEDVTATRYFDDMLCAVGSAIRGFSVVRDMFQTHWDTLKSAKETATKQAEQLQLFSPLSKEGIWGKIVGGAVGLGLGAPLNQTLKARTEHSSIVSLLLVVGCVALSIIGMEVFVEWLRSRQTKRIEKLFPSELMAFWEERSLTGYRIVLRQFLPLAYKITNRHYPGSHPDTITDSEVEDAVEEHFAFQPKSKPIPEAH